MTASRILGKTSGSWPAQQPARAERAVSRGDGLAGDRRGDRADGGGSGAL